MTWITEKKKTIDFVIEANQAIDYNIFRNRTEPSQRN